MASPRTTIKKCYWDECHYDGHLYGLVSTAYDLALYYNKTSFPAGRRLFRPAASTRNRAPRTIAELDEYAKALDRIDSSGRIILAGYIPAGAGVVHQLHLHLVRRKLVE